MYYNTITDIINDLRPVKKNVTEFITLQLHAKGRPPQDRDAHDIVMAYVDLALLALFVIRELKAKGVEYEIVAKNIMKITREHPRLLKWLWDNEDCYFCRITKLDLMYNLDSNETEKENI